LIEEARCGERQQNVSEMRGEGCSGSLSDAEMKIVPSSLKKGDVVKSPSPNDQG
jgi:hypothetical protein